VHLVHERRCGEIVTRLGSAANQVDVSTIHSFLYRNVVRPYLHLMRDGDGQPLVSFASVDGHDEHHPSYTIVDEWLRSIGQAKILQRTFDDRDLQRTFEQQRDILNDKLSHLVWQRSVDGDWTVGPRNLDRMGKMLNAILHEARTSSTNKRDTGAWASSITRTSSISRTGFSESTHSSVIA
jgi:DNA helicase-2/ATP-dependent DNA helicase PcrA